jgi:hypothetical protein
MAVDHSAFADVLKHVDEHGMVDYAAIKAEPARLDAYLAELAAVKLDSLDEKEKLATLLNAYNAFTLKLIAERYPIKSIKDIPEAERWKAVRWNLGGTVTSLDAIEHEMIRKGFNEPRIHFALVCAGKGCPPLRNEPYTGEKLDAQLDDQMRKTHASDGQWVTYDAETNTLTLTAIYKWFEGDFTKNAKSVPAWVGRFRPEVARAVESGNVPKVVYAEYDWGLNEK